MTVPTCQIRRGSNRLPPNVEDHDPSRTRILLVVLLYYILAISLQSSTMVVVVVVFLYCILAHRIRVWSTYAINAYRIQSDRDPDPLAEGDRQGEGGTARGAVHTGSGRNGACRWGVAGRCCQARRQKREKGSSRTKQSCGGGARRCRCGFQHCLLYAASVLLSGKASCCLLLFVYSYIASIIHGAFCFC